MDQQLGPIMNATPSCYCCLHGIGNGQPPAVGRTLPNEYSAGRQLEIEHGSMDSTIKTFDPPKILNTLDAKRGKCVAREFMKAATLPRYPKTADQGFCYVLPNKPYIGDKPQGGDVFKDVRFCHKLSSASETTCSPYDSTDVNNTVDVRCRRIVFECRGVKACQYLDPKLRNMSYYEVPDNALYKDPKKTSGSHYRRSKRSSLEFVFSCRQDFDLHKACAYARQHRDSNDCRPVVRQVRNAKLGIDTWVIQCVRYANAGGHFWRLIPEEHHGRIDKIERILNGDDGSCDFQDTCSTVDIVRRKKTCEHAHLQEPKMVRIPCTARWTAIIPYSPAAPYIYVVGTGKHTHPPPPDNAPPAKVRNEVVALMTAMVTAAAATTFAEFRASQQFRQLEAAYPEHGLENGAYLRYLFDKVKGQVFAQPQPWR